MDDFSFETRLLHADRVDAHDTNVSPPIFQSSTFAFDDAKTMAHGAVTPNYETFYTRYGNPNHAHVARMMASLEGGDAAIVTASGMGAVTAVAMTLLNAGDHVVAQHVTYAGTRALLTQLLPRFGVEATFVDQTDPAAFAAAIRPNTRLFMLETPSNPLLGITDLAAVSRIAHAHGALVAIDNTIATPINQRPLQLGADLVWHSATKYLGGHSDLVAGVVVTTQTLVERLWQTQIILGATLAPFEAWLLLRGLRTLDVRIERQNRNAMVIAEHLTSHPRVTRVHYPGLMSHPGHDVAARQMRGFGGLLSFELDGSFEDARRLLASVRLIRTAVSLGGVETLAVAPAAMWPDVASSADAERMGVRPSLIRLSVGLEAPADLIADLDEALAKTS